MNRCLIGMAAAVVGTNLVALFLLVGGCGQAKPAGGAAGMVQPVVGGLDENIFRRQWMNILPLDKSDVLSRLFVSGNVVLAYTPNNVVYTVNGADGDLRYFRYVNGGGRQIGKPVVLADWLVFSGQSNLEVYKRSTGDLEKSIPLGFTISSDATGVDNHVYLGADLSGGELADIDVTVTYRPVRWQLLTFGEVRGAPTVFDGVIYVGSGDGGVRAVTSERGAYWFLDHDTFNTDGEILGDLKADDLGVYAASTSGRLVCLDRTSGQLKWQYIAPHGLEEGPVVTRTAVYEVVPGFGLVALDKVKLMAVDPNGRPKVEELNRTARWVCPRAAQFVSEDRLYAYVRTIDNQLWALDRQSGQVVYRGKGTHFGAMATNINDSTIYAATPDGVVYAIKPMLEPGSPGIVQ